MIGTILLFKGNLRESKVKRRGLTPLSIDWMLPPIMSLLKKTVDKDSMNVHVLNFFASGNLNLVDEYAFINCSWDLSRIVHLTAWYSDSGDARRWLRKLFTLVMEQNDSVILTISDIDAFLIGCVLEMTNYYHLKKVTSVQEMLYINSLHSWGPNQNQVLFWQTLLSKYSFHKLIVSHILDQNILNDYITEIRGGSSEYSKIYAYISFRFSRRMKYRNEPLFDDCNAFLNYYSTCSVSKRSNNLLWNYNISEE